MVISRLATTLFIAGVGMSDCGCTASTTGYLSKETVEGGTKVEAVKTINTPDTEGQTARDIGFESSLKQGKDSITASYTVTNNSNADIYLLDAYPAVDENRQAFADLQAFYLSFREPSTAVVLKGVPPPPTMPVAKRIMPLGTKLEPKASVSREFNLPLPLRERSDWYYPPKPPEEYEPGSIENIVMLVQFVRSTAPGFQANVAHYASDFYIVNANEFVTHVETLRNEFVIPNTQLFLRKDRFSRL